jgi:putative DNA primase/helicase
MIRRVEKLEALHKKCGLCRKFHTVDCPAESADSLRGKAYYQDEGSEPFDEGCFEFDSERVDKKDLIGLFAKMVSGNFTIKHFVKGGSSLGLFKWEEGRYVACEEWLRACLEKMGRELGLEEKVRNHLVNEVVEKVKRLTYFELKEEPLKIAFKNVVLDWKAFLDGDLDKALRPIEETKEQPVFHLIPYELNKEVLQKCLANFCVESGIIKVAGEEASEVVNIFKSWVGDAWPLLFEVIGYCLYPDYPFNKAFMFVGNGRNGKSTFLRLVKQVLGEENVVGLSLQDICLYRFAASELYHKLSNIFPDIPTKPIGYAGWFKVLTGEDTVSAPRKFRESIYFKNYAKLLFSANELPQVEDMSEAFWRRWIVVEFPNKFDDDPTFFEEAFPKEVIEKIIVLSLLAFLNVYKSRAFTVKGSEADFKEKWLRNANSIYAYVKDGEESGRLALKREAYTPADQLYQDYIAWCEENDVEAQTKNMFTRELERLFGVAKKQRKEKGKRFYAYESIKLLEREEGDFHSCEVCGKKATTRIIREDGEHWLCGKCLNEWPGNL